MTIEKMDTEQFLIYAFALHLKLKGLTEKEMLDRLNELLIFLNFLQLQRMMEQ